MVALLICCVLYTIVGKNKLQAQENLNWFKNAVTTSIQQLKKASDTYKPGLNPRSVYPDGKVRVAPQSDWTTGFFPGSLWYGYELSGDEILKADARKFTLGLDAVQYYKDTHDVGFMLYSS